MSCADACSSIWVYEGFVQMSASLKTKVEQNEHYKAIMVRAVERQYVLLVFY